MMTNRPGITRTDKHQSLWNQSTHCLTHCHEVSMWNERHSGVPLSWIVMFQPDNCLCFCPLQGKLWVWSSLTQRARANTTCASNLFQINKRRIFWQCAQLLRVTVEACLCFEAGETRLTRCHLSDMPLLSHVTWTERKSCFVRHTAQGELFLQHFCQRWVESARELSHWFLNSLSETICHGSKQRHISLSQLSVIQG